MQSFKTVLSIAAIFGLLFVQGSAMKLEARQADCEMNPLLNSVFILTLYLLYRSPIWS
jgi:hypothetical protein